MKQAILLIILLVLASFSSAHIPELVLEDRNYTNEPILVEEPEISYAYYGKLQGSPQVYKIVADKPFHLYVSLLVPYVGGSETSDVEFHIMKDGEKIVMRHNYQNWTKWYEEYGGDWYLQGPTYETEAEPGTYLIEVHSDANSEDYSLAIGNIERFGPVEITRTIFVLPLMKALFWANYSLLALFFIAFIVVVGLAYMAIRKYKK